MERREGETERIKKEDEKQRKTRREEIEIRAKKSRRRKTRSFCEVKNKGSGK